MAEDEESISNVNNPIMTYELKPEPVIESSATSPTAVVESNTILPVPESEVGPPVVESEVAGDSCQHSGGGDANVGVAENGENDEAMVEGEVVAEASPPMKEPMVTGTENEENKVVGEENVTALVKDEVAEAVNVTKEEASSCLPAGTVDETVVMTRNENENENDETMGEANISIVEDRKKLEDAENGETKIVTRNDNMENGATKNVTRNDNMENGEMVTEANVLTVEASSSLGLGKDGEMEAIKSEEVEIPPIVLDDLGGVTLEKEDETMDADDEKTANEEKVVVTQNEENDKMASGIDISAAEAGIELEKDVEMGTTKHDEGTGAEGEAATGEKVVVTRKEGNNEMVTQVDTSAVEARIESEKDVEMDTMKHEEGEPVPLEEDEGTGAANGEKVVTRNKGDDEMASGVDITAVEARIESEKDVETHEMKHEEVEHVSLDEEEDEETGAEDEAANATTTEIETETDMTESGKAFGGKRKRKITKSTGKSKSGGRTSSKKAIGEDVCFICFDGGALVLCDRRGCTKAYHPSCIDRDEEFFRAKGRWNCGWHQCTICQKNAYYMCYTCTFSLCKGCIKDDVILCVRGNKGFCKICMRTVKLIEGLGKEDNDGPVDFDDKSSFEYLFKDYLMDLKTKLSLSSDEIADAKSPWKGANVSASKQELAEAQFDNNDDAGSGSDASTETLEASKTKKRKLRKRSKPVRNEEDATTTAVTISEGFSTAGTTEWASKELLEFVKHMKSGDTSVLSQFDVQALLLEYIKTNKLRDPRRKSQIICDSRLERLFGKPRVGHFEMLKLLESHFLMKEDSQTDDVQGSVVDTEFNQFEADANAETPTRAVKDKKRKRKKGENRGPQSNLDEYAAIDVHNISLIYLRRKLVEDLFEEDDKFRDKIIGTFVRIRISGNVQKQDLYRLVQVVGTSKAAEPYKLGKRTTDIVLEILNLNKTEILSIDTISNQDFTEEECKRLRQSMRCGLIDRPKVRDILDKAMEIHAARVNDWLESEILRLSHLRDRASEKGRKKELRECVEKLQLLKTPDERQRRLEEVPEIHADPKMDPSYESEDEDSESNDRRDVYMRSRDSSFSRRGRAPVSPRSNFSPKESWGAVGKVSSKNLELNRSSSGKNVLSRSEDGAHSGGGLNEDTWNEGRDRETESKNLEKPSSAANSDPTGRNSQFLSRTESFSGVSSVGSPAILQSKVAETSIKINEAEKMWHYKDPSGKIQGPFSMVQLRKWSNTGYFPAELKIWKTTDKQEESILLTDTLAGRFEKVPSAVDNILSTTVLQKQDGERPQVDQNIGSQNSRRLVPSGGGMTSSGEVSALSTENWSNSDSMNLPSPTPKQNNAGWVGGDGSAVTAANLYPSGNRVLQSPPAPPDGGIHMSTSVQNSGVHSVRGLDSNNVNSGSDFGLAPTSEQVTAAQSGYSLQNVQSFASSSEQHTAVMNSQFGAWDAAALQAESLDMQNPNVDVNTWVAAAPSKGEPNVSVLAPGQPQGYGNWGTTSSSVQNVAGNYSNAGASVLPQPDYWRAPAQGSQQNIQPTTMLNVPWGGLQENMSSASALRPENNNGWGMMPGNPNVGWGGPVPAIMNVNWGATVQAMPQGNPNPGWVPTGPLPGNPNPGWVAQSGNPGVQGVAPGNANPGWVAPTVSSGSTIQAPTSGNGWAAIGTGNPGAHIQGPSQGDSNQGRGAPSGSRGTRNNDHHEDGRFSGQRDKGSHGSNSGYNSRNWDRQPSSGSRGPGGSSRGGFNRNKPCPYYPSGRCIKGPRCNFLHN
ncbi:zinc finger CCCH domain-containing protein 19-like isoform X1 [Nicotiana tomentosiformis]|uniref:zinc finger CCCH domain-containing protein 19-like isoform X1 n=1 Tax=Nicotiana tomentosiformis TaxID=4098 RepID=UPI00051AC359|nr:zinc finger CCCH domain-containing protein 19-like isoform X1 [Nicotiana tomentosiformis]